jgi:hypothetical protein
MWQELKDQTDVEELMRVFGSFHDSCLKEIAVRNREYVASGLAMGFDNPTAVRFLFQRQFRNPVAIELQFEDVEDFNWVHFNTQHDTGFSVIYQAVFFWQDSLLYWAEDIDWHLTADDRNDFRWISAKRARWRTVEDGAGPEDKLLSFA